MPDWSYRPLLRPLLFRLDAHRARQLTLTVVGAVGNHRLGWRLLERVGRLHPHASLARSHLGLTLSRVEVVPVTVLLLRLDGRDGLGVVQLGASGSPALAPCSGAP